MHGIITNHMLLWGSLFKKTWDSLSLTEKLIWFFFLNQTIAVITLIEFILLKK